MNICKCLTTRDMEVVDFHAASASITNNVPAGFGLGVTDALEVSDSDHLLSCSSLRVRAFPCRATTTPTEESPSNSDRIFNSFVDDKEVARWSLVRKKAK